MDPAKHDRRLPHAVREHLAVIKGWTHLLIREGNKPTLDIARMTLIAHRLEASISALEQENRQQRRGTGSAVEGS